MWRFSVLGFPITVEPWFWLTAFFLGGGLGVSDGASMTMTVIWMVVIFVSILVHELGHALASRRYGAYPEIRLIAFGGVTLMQGGYFNRWQSIIVSAAGPAFGFLLAGVSLLLAATVKFQSPYLAAAVSGLIFINVFWTIINLLPILPMDGGQILRAFLGPDRHRIACIIGAVFAVGVGIVAYLYGMLILAIFMGFFAYSNFVNQNMPGGVVHR